MAGFLDDLRGMLGGTAPQPVAGGMTNYGAAPSATSLPAVENLLARLNPNRPGAASPTGAAGAGGALGVSTPLVGGDMASAIAGGVGAVRPGDSAGAAFVSGLAGALGSRQSSQLAQAKLGMQQNSAALQNALSVLKIQQQLRSQQAVQEVGKYLSGNGEPTMGGGGGPPAPMAGGGGGGMAPAPAMAPAGGGGGMPAAGGGGQPTPESLAAESDPSPDGAPMAPAAPAAAPPSGGGGGQQQTASAQPTMSIPDYASPATLYRRSAQLQHAADIATSGGNPEFAAQLLQRAQMLDSRATAMINSHQTISADGRVVPLPGAAEAAASLETAKAQAEANVKDQHELVKVQPVAGGPFINVPKSQVLASAGGQTAGQVAKTQAADGQQQQDGEGVGNGSMPGGSMPSNVNIAEQPKFYEQRIDKLWKDQDAMTDQYHARQDAIGRLTQLQQILGQYQSGAFADKKAEAFAALKGLGLPITDGMQQNVDSYQEFQKLATKQVFEDVKKMGGRVLVSEIEGLTRANANPNLQPGANQAILGSAIGALRREDQYYKDFTDWHNKNPTAYDASHFEIPWNEKNPAIRYSEQGIKDTPAKGIEIPAPAQRTDGQVYVTPKGPARWVAGSGWQLMGGQ